jgi:hypothetical protein
MKLETRVKANPDGSLPSVIEFEVSSLDYGLSEMQADCERRGCRLETQFNLATLLSGAAHWQQGSADVNGTISMPRPNLEALEAWRKAIHES